MKANALVETREDVERLLKHGLAPMTSNRIVLLELGFTPAFPEVQRGYQSSIWERPVDRGSRERAYLIR